MPRPRKQASRFRYFHSWPEAIRLVVMMYVRFRCPCDMSRTCYSSAASMSARFGPMFAGDICC